MLNRRGPISRLVGGAIGLTQEFQADRKEKKAAQVNATENEGANSSQAALADVHASSADSQAGAEQFSDDEEWALNLDEAQRCEVSDNSSVQESLENFDVDQFLRNFIAHHPVPEELQRGQLPMPVILPQRRPESRHRGFVHAYAPVLEQCDIDQGTWFEFLDGFEKSIKANPWFHVINGAVWLAGNIEQAVAGVSLIAGFVTMAIHVGVEASRRAYIHYQQNKYLDVMNEQFFKPRGLYCLVMNYKPSSEELVEDVDIDHNIEKMVETHQGQSKWKRMFSASNTTTKHDAEMPEAAPLTFPQQDNLDEQQKKNSVKRFGNFLLDYYDRQAAAKFAAQNPDTKIPQAPRKEFASKYSDPTHPAGSGGLISIASGGKYNPVGPLGRLQEKITEHRSERGIDRPVGIDARKEKRNNRPLRRMLKQNALYLMVVNMPTQEEMDLVLSEVNRSSDAQYVD